MGVPHDGSAHRGERAAHRGARGRAGAVVGDEHRAGVGEDVPGRRRQVVHPARSALVEPEQRPALHPDPPLDDGAAGSGDGDEPHPRLPHQVGEPLPVGVAGDRRHEHHLAVTGAGGERGREPGAAGAQHLLVHVDDRHRRVGREPARGADDVGVEQQVAHHHQRAAGHGASPSIGTAPSQRSTAAQRTWTATRCSSWTVAG
ncbi:hypothetical protein [Nocardioides sp. TF02-7]|uniref:hypothetical protein n=1 Tax=Nocardioides sp. TF02-7 TaxID=2917724 RepID=UPI001F05AB1C|nr:hypothetical protein [Nocardioides sp. TF02-7]UMG93650.1 hypothetical protein MF408_05555 [Nocardioides sp. TF02-7]